MLLSLPQRPFEFLLSQYTKQQKKPWADACASFLHNIIIRAGNGPALRGGSRVVLNALTCRELVGGHQRTILPLWLSRYAYIERQYRVGVSARVYRLKSHGNEVIEYTLQTEKAIKRFQSFYNASRWETRPEVAAMPSVALQGNFMRSGRVSVDRPLIEAVRMSEADTPYGYFRMASLSSVLNSTAFSTDGCRLYHPLTNIPRRYRPALLFDGEPVVEVDVGSCFLLMIAYLMADIEDGFFEDAVADDVYRMVSEKMFSFMPYDQSRPRAKEALNAAISVPLGEEDYLSTEQQEAWGWFSKYYPLRAGWVRERREAFTNSKGETKIIIYPVLAREESRRMLPAVESLLQEGIPVVSLHDGVLTTRRHSERVKEVLGKAFPGSFCYVKDFSEFATTSH